MCGAWHQQKRGRSRGHQSFHRGRCVYNRGHAGQCRDHPGDWDALEAAIKGIEDERAKLVHLHIDESLRGLVEARGGRLSKRELKSFVCHLEDPFSTRTPWHVYDPIERGVLKLDGKEYVADRLPLPDNYVEDEDEPEDAPVESSTWCANPFDFGFKKLCVTRYEDETVSRATPYRRLILKDRTELFIGDANEFLLHAEPTELINGTAGNAFARRCRGGATFDALKAQWDSEKHMFGFASIIGEVMNSGKVVRASDGKFYPRAERHDVPLTPVNTLTDEEANSITCAMTSAVTETAPVEAAQKQKVGRQLQMMRPIYSTW